MILFIYLLIHSFIHLFFSQGSFGDFTEIELERKFNN